MVENRNFAMFECFAKDDAAIEMLAGRPTLPPIFRPVQARRPIGSGS
jgi:hypothetical protein